MNEILLNLHKRMAFENNNRNKRGSSPSTGSNLSNSYFDLPNIEPVNFNFDILNDGRRNMSPQIEHNMEDLYKVINVQQNTINKLTLEVPILFIGFKSF